MLKLDRHYQTITARLDGEIDHHHVRFLRAAIDRILDDSQAKILIFDLSQVDFMDSSGIGLIIGRYKRMRSQGGQVYLSGNHSRIDRILELSGLPLLIRHIDSADERSVRG